MDTTRLPKHYIWLAIIGVWAVAYTSQIHFDAWRFYSPSIINTTYNEFIEPQPLSPPNARLASFGATEFAADLLWIRTIQYYGGGTPYGKYRKLGELFQTITELSPRFKQAYMTGLVILPGEGFIDEAIALGEKGQQNLPESWEMPYYTGLVYHIHQKNYAKAGEKFNQAALHSDAPAITKLFAGIYFKEANQRKTAYLIFQTVLETSEDEFVRDRAEKYLGHLEGLLILEAAVAKYRDIYHKLPGSLAELVSVKILPKLPTSPLVGTSYSYNKQTGQITEKILEN